jgi:hypothetical protein
MLDRLHPRRLDADARTFGVGYLLLLPFYLAPLFVARFLPGLDLPFHLSMADMLRKQSDPSSPYQLFYEGGFSVAPYAAHYIAMRLFGLVMPLMAAHKLVIALYVASFPLATAALLGAGGRSRIPALLAFPLAYNLSLHYGFVSFALSVPVVLILLACLARFLDRPETNVWLGAGTAFAAVLLFLCHLQNFLFGVCAALSFVVFGRYAWRRRLLGLATLLPATALLLIWHWTRDFAAPTPGDRRSWSYVWQLFRARRLTETSGRPWLVETTDRLDVLPVHLLRGFTDQVDVLAAKILVIVLAGYLLLGLIGLFERAGATFRPRLRVAGFIVFGGALFAYLMLPHHLPEYELMTFYPRFSVLVVVTALLVIPASLRKLGGVMRPFVMLPALLMTGAYAFELVRHYRYYDKEVADFDAVVRKVPPGGRALGLVYDRNSRVMRIESALVGLPHLYPALRPAPSTMVPLHYCGMRHMPCRWITPPIKPLPAPSAWSPGNLQPQAAIDFFDYFFVRLPPNRPIFGEGLSRLELFAQEGSWLVYRRKPSAPERSPSASATPARR